MFLKHLDLGRGTRPKNPFGHPDLHGVDSRADADNSFDSVSACDFFKRMARMCGFNGEFRLIRQCWVHPRGAYAPTKPSFGHRLRAIGERISGQQSHLVWEFAATKKTADSK